MASEDIEAWAQAQKTLPRPPTDAELAVFAEFFKAPSSDVSQLAPRIAAFHIKPFAESEVGTFWAVLGDAVNKLTSQNDKLAELVLQLQRLPDGRGVMGPDPWWSDLPYFNNYWTEWQQFLCEYRSRLATGPSPGFHVLINPLCSSRRQTAVPRLFVRLPSPSQS